QYLDGRLYYCAVYDDDLSAVEIDRIAEDYVNPHDVAGADLVSYVPMWGNSPGTYDMARFCQFPTAGGPLGALTAAGAPTGVDDHHGGHNFLFTWPMEDSVEIPSTANDNYGAMYLKSASGGVLPVIDYEDGTPIAGFGTNPSRKALYLDSDNQGAHSEFNFVIQRLGGGLEDEVYMAADFAQHITQDYPEQDQCSNVNRGYTGRYVKVNDQLTETGGNAGDLTPEWQQRHAWNNDNGHPEWWISTGGPFTQSYSDTDYIGADGTRRLRLMWRFWNDGGQRKVTWYREKQNGDYEAVQTDSITMAGNTCAGLTLRSRSQSDLNVFDASDGGSCTNESDPNNENDPRHEVWVSNIAIGEDVDDVWEFQDNTTGGDNNPDDTP
ncbi:MAG: hypothetical protein HKN91_08500, partial [Acidimicrobiia bacterium]|nr:hypothetical protein [Acidimicrobiia bacterium]